MSEAKAYSTFRENVIRPGDRCDRVENVMVDGMPDVSLCLRRDDHGTLGHESWIEIKVPTEPKRATTRLLHSQHKFSVDQINWFFRQRTAGGACWALISTDRRWILLAGAWVEEINGMTIADMLDNATWSTSKPVKDKQQWMFLRRALMS